MQPVVGTALVRRPGPRLAEGIVTHIERSVIDSFLAKRQWDGYVTALESNGWDLIEVPPADDCPTLRSSRTRSSCSRWADLGC
jgi:dimethylargininase